MTMCPHKVNHANLITKHVHVNTHKQKGIHAPMLLFTGYKNRSTLLMILNANNRDQL